MNEARRVIEVRRTIGASWLALLTALSAQLVSAQGAPPRAAEPGASQPTTATSTPPDTTATAAPEQTVSNTVAPTPTADVATETAAELAVLKAEVAALKAKQDDAEVAGLMARDEASAIAVEPPLLRVYGFMDFGIDKLFFGKNDDNFALLRPTPATTFVFGNLNLYFEAAPVEHLRTMVELRFTLAPHGEEISLGPPLGTVYERVDTTTFDFSSPSAQAQLRLGGMFIERAWSEYAFSSLLKVQWGLFLNPFGIWNLDHGSPTLISLMLPIFIASQMIPTRLLGVHVYGSKFFDSFELGYALHVSNGRTPLDFDLTEDKGVGARLYLANEGDYGRLVLGASGYLGTYVDQEKKINVVGSNIFDWSDTVNYSEQLLGLDVALDVADLRVRSEAVLRWIEYEGGKSERIFTRDGTAQYLTSRLEWATYLIAAYRTPWRLEPYLQGELSHKSYTMPRFAGASRATGSNAATVVLSVGLNVELTTHTLLKTQLAWTRAYTVDFSTKIIDVPALFIRVVDSF
jgi:hypothetical protein